MYCCARLLMMLAVALVLVTGVAEAADPALTRAVRSRDAGAVKTLVQRGVDVNAPDADGATALHWAAYGDDLETADVLLRAGASPNAADDHGVAPLFLAAQNGGAAMVERLLKAGAKPNQPALPNKVTPLMAAARAGNARAVEALLRARADVRARETMRDQTALMWAAAERHPQVVRALVEAGANVHDRSKSAVVFAAIGEEKGAPQTGQVADLVEGGYTPLLFAARSGDVESARVLIEAGAPVNDEASSHASALVVAAHSGQTELARLLLERGADPNSDGAGYTPLHAAVLRGDEVLANALSSRGANPNALLKAATIHRRFHKDWTFDAAWVGASPLFLAARFADAGMMRVLVKAGADPKFTTKDGVTILMAAAGVGTRGVSESSGTDRRGRALDPAEIETALAHDEDTRAIMPSGIEAVRYAIELGVDVNAASAAGDTALHGAALHGFKSVIDALLKNGARLDMKNKSGQTPLAVAKQQKRSPAVLQKLGTV